VLRTDWSGNVLDTLALLSPLEGLVFQSGTKYLVRAQPFQWLPILEPGPNGRRVFIVDFPEQRDGDSAAVHVTAFDQGGGQLYLTELHVARTRISQAVADSVYDAAARSMERSGGWTLRQAEQAAHDQIRMPSAYAPVTAAVAASDGSLWLRLWGQPKDRRTWVVLDPSGTQNARVVTPPGVSIRAVNEGTVWGVEYDELDVPYIMEYRIQRS
jgi:hypothetical protein